MKYSRDYPSSSRFWSGVLTFTFLFLVSTPWALRAQTLKKVPFPFSPIGLNCLPWFIAKDARIGEKYSLDFDPVFIGASSALVQSMLSGAADYAGSGGPSVIANVLKGGDIIHITAMVPRFTQSIMVYGQTGDQEAGGYGGQKDRREPARHGHALCFADGH